VYSITIDPSACSYLALCPCGWRGEIAPSRLAALVSGQRHIHVSHPEDARRINECVRLATRRTGVNRRLTA
jgi:hypothetical protein